MRGLLALCLCAAAWLAAAPAWGAQTYAERLRTADAVRSADPAQFKTQLAALNADAAQAGPGEREYLEYLNAYALAYGGEYDAAILRLRTLAQEAADASLRFRAGALLVNSLAATRNFTEGLRHLDGMLALVDRIDDKELRHQGIGVAALIYNQVGQYELGQHYAERILADEPGTRSRCYAGLLRVEALQNRHQLANDAEVEQVIAQCVEHKEALLANLMRAQLARKWAGEGKQAEAAKLLQANLAEVEATRYPRLIGEVHSLLAEYRLALGDPQEARMHAERAIANSSGIEFSLPLVAAHRVLFEVARARGDTAAALEHYIRYADADRAYLDATQARELAVQLVRHETVQKTHTIELLNRQNRVLVLEQQVARQAATNSQLLLALALLLLASLGYWAWKTRRLHDAMKRLAETDALTGISNRRHFSEQARARLARAREAAGSAGLVMFDLDHFKQVNDHYGHATGDWVLRQVAAACRALVGPQDCFGRVGGEEFALLLAGADAAAAAARAQELRAAIAAVDAREGGASFNVSASFGVTSTALSGYDLDRLMQHADQQAYASKQAGRNRVSVRPAAEDSATAAGG